MSSQTVPVPAISTEHYGITTGLAFNDIIGSQYFTLLVLLSLVNVYFIQLENFPSRPRLPRS